MRATIELPTEVYRRVSELARKRQQSLSAVVAELTARGLATLGEPTEVLTDPVSGLPCITLGRRISSEMVADLLDDRSVTD